MELIAIISGMISAFVLGFTLRRAGPPGSPHQLQEVRDELEGLRLEWHDTLDKISHLYGRIRKRVPDEAESVKQLTPPATLNGKDAIRARAVAAGLWPGRKSS